MLNKNEEKLKENAINLITLRLKMCILNLSNDVCQYVSEEKDYTEPSEILEIKKDLFKYIKSLGKELESDVGQRQTYVSAIEDLRKRLVEAARKFCYFDSCLTAAGKKVINAHRLHFSSYPAESANNVKSLMVTQDCISFLSEAEEQSSILASRLMGCFPHLMTKASFADYLRRSMEILFSDSPNEFVQRAADAIVGDLLPFETADISADYPDMYNRVKEIFNTKFNNMSEDDMRDIAVEIYEISVSFNDMFEDYNVIYNDINYLYLVAKYAADAEHIFSDFEIKDLYYSSCELLENGNSLALEETISEKAEDKLSAIFDETQKAEKRFSRSTSKLSQKKREEINPEVSAFFDIVAAITSYYLSELSFEIDYSSVEGAADEDATDEEINSAVKRVNEACNKLAQNYCPADQKLLKQLAIRNIPCPFSEREFEKFIYNTIEKLRGKKTIFIALDDISQLFEEEGFLPDGYDGDDFEDDDDDFIHEHDHNSDREHHHHH